MDKKPVCVVKRFMKNNGNLMICKMYINNLNYQMCKKNN